MKDGPEITPEADILDDQEEKIGTITVSSPAWTFDGDVEYTLTQVLIDNGIADNSEFAVIPFNSSASLIGSVDASFTIHLSSVTTEDVAIDYATQSNVAGAGTDFVEATGQLIIAADESSGEITVEVLDDTDVEANNLVK